MKVRVVTAIVGLLVFIPILFFSNALIFKIVYSLLSLISAFEMLRCVGVVRKFLLSIPLLAFSALFPLLTAVPSEYSYLAVIIAMLYCMVTVVIYSGALSIQDTSVAFVSVFFISLAYACIVSIRESFSYVFLLVYIGAWISDTFAYLVGMNLGKTPLMPQVSPNKTVEGAIGGVAAVMLAYPVFGYIIQRITDYKVSFILLVVVGLFASLLSQIGDLIMSAIKRCYGIKDYGRIFPGHGGMLDRFDSTLIIAPMLCICLNVFKIFYV